MPRKKEIEPICPVCHKKCLRCTRPPFIPENPKVTLNEVLLFLSSAGRRICTNDLVARFGMSRQDASNRMRKLQKMNYALEAARDGRALLYEITDAGTAAVKRMGQEE